VDRKISKMMYAKSIIIGGGQVYQEAMDKDLVDELLITHVHASPEGDVFSRI
jgi:dihydrofolate reductase